MTFTAPLHRAAAPLSVLAVAVVIAGALAAVEPAVTDNTSSLSAQQCYGCKNGECKKNGPGGTECNTHHDSDGNGGAMSGANQVRYASLDGTRIPLHRVGPHHFAAMSCQDADDWVVLGRESATGDIEVTTNPIPIGLRRWLFQLEEQHPVATIQTQE